MAKKTNYTVNGVSYYRIRTTKGQPIGTDGKQKYKTILGKTKKEAEQLLAEYLESIKGNNKDRDKPFVERFDKWLWVVHAASLKESSFARYLMLFNKWIATAPFSGFKLDEIESIDIQEYLNSIPPTIAESVYNLMSTFYKYAVVERYVPYSPLLTVKIPPKPYKKPKKDVLTREDVLKLNEIFSKDPSLFIFKFALYTGMRISEILGLTHEDIDIKNKVISVNKGLRRIQDFTGGPNKTKIVITSPKTDAGVRNIPIYSEILMDLRAHMVSEEKKHTDLGLTFTPHTLLFTTRYCLPPRADKTNDRFKKLQLDNGIEPVTFHKLRATFATMLADDGVPIKTLLELMGDKDVDTLMHYYTKVDMQSKSKALKSFENYSKSI